MTEDDVVKEFQEVGALMKGHFILSSGLHSDTYLQCARIMMEASRGERFCRELAVRVRAAVNGAIDMIVSPAMGGILVGYELGRQLDCPSIFLERVEGVFTARRGFHIPEGARCLMVEDVVTTGLSSRECIAAIRASGGHVVAGACLIDRSGGKADIGVPLIALAELDVMVYDPNSLPSWLLAIPTLKPGSRQSVSS